MIAPPIRAEAFGIYVPVDMLWHMATLAERVEHALETRKMKRIDLDRALATALEKKATSASGFSNRLLGRTKNPRAHTIRALAKVLNVSERWLLTGDGPMDRGTAGESQSYDSLPGWAEAAKEEAGRGRIQEYVIRAAGRSPAFVRPAKITADFVVECAMFWLRHAPEEDRMAAMDVEAKRLTAVEDAKR